MSAGLEKTEQQLARAYSELEVIRDRKGNVITVCSMEDFDPVGVHTGDSFCTAPMLTISEDLQKELAELYST